MRKNIKVSPLLHVTRIPLQLGSKHSSGVCFLFALLTCFQFVLCSQSIEVIRIFYPDLEMNCSLVLELQQRSFPICPPKFVQFSRGQPHQCQSFHSNHPQDNSKRLETLKSHFIVEELKVKKDVPCPNVGTQIQVLFSYSILYTILRCSLFPLHHLYHHDDHHITHG